MDRILELIERYAGKLHNWAWDKRWKERDSNKWIKGYREWKKRKCPHNQPIWQVFSMEKALLTLKNDFIKEKRNLKPIGISTLLVKWR